MEYVERMGHWRECGAWGRRVPIHERRYNRMRKGDATMDRGGGIYTMQGCTEELLRYIYVNI